MRKPVSQRVAIHVPVTLRMTMAGQSVALSGTTVFVNAHGAMIQCSRRIDWDARVELQNDQTGQKQICKVISTPTANQQSYLVPLEFDAANPGFWQICFPPTDWKPIND